ncbi:MAG: tRNA (N(6)-L-threonylcarbamoyladenosine(37)-C(2))-methylthiotransferase MtaB [Bacteroidota bacterium]|nr:tRNA (N(6)-L-threonylcarbamoyladenosine(37)-C(2))-methylthiotransferase MtaB [Rhodothermia bacterium]MDW8286031.1 tRNA (N(6)-L-threonylcarbamoyladenosine(37)-C(2))-methylthiotransferase MtaB [Bacteroidota bacterium]
MQAEPLCAIDRHSAPEQEPSVAFCTLGCKLNFAETSTLRRQFAARGFRLVEDEDPADVYVINTCAVTEAAERECRKIIRRLLRQNPAAYVIVTGCYAQLRPEELAAIPGVDLVLGAAEKLRLFEYVRDFRKKPEPEIRVSCIDGLEEIAPAYSFGDRTRAFLKVQDGCDYRCAFCTIPKARGPSRSLPLESVLEQAWELASQGVQEIVLSGVNVGDYGRKIGTSLLELLRQLERVPIPRYRISSIEPNLLTPEIVDFVADSERFMPHFHIPLQSGSDRILARMRRRYRRRLYAERALYIKKRLPHAAIGADVIVGFPGETEADFEATCAFLAELPVSYLHVFTYSERPGTPAAQMDGVVPAPVRQERNRRLRLLAYEKRRAFYEEHAGSMRPVLFEATESAGQMSGFTDNYIRVRIPYAPALINRIVPVRLGPPEEGDCVSGTLIK